jgi:phosphoserine phosphatase RsbU/P
MRRALPLVLATLCAAATAPAQHFDLGKDRIPIADLNGPWRFHTGDDLRWADPSFDDSNWPPLDSDRSWVEQGYPEYNGIAWYRFKVDVPVGMDDLSLFLPQIWSCYEVYADGKLIAAFGKMPPNSSPYTSWFNNQVYALPSGIRQGKTIEIALRVWSPRNL